MTSATIDPDKIHHTASLATDDFGFQPTSPGLLSSHASTVTPELVDLEIVLQELDLALAIVSIDGLEHNDPGREYAAVLRRVIAKSRREGNQRRSAEILFHGLIEARSDLIRAVESIVDWRKLMDILDPQALERLVPRRFIKEADPPVVTSFEWTEDDYKASVSLELFLEEENVDH